MVIQGVVYPSDFEAKKAIITAAAKLEAKGHLVAGDGSISVRVGPNAIWITVEGADKSCLQQDQLVRIDLSGKQAATNKPKPLGEDLPIHLRIYRENEEIRAVVHTYPVCAAVLSGQGTGLEAAAYTPSVRRMGRIQLLPAGDAQTVGMLCRTDRGVLLREDGFLSWGKTLAEALQTVETLDYCFKVRQSQGKGCTCGHSGTGICDGSCKSDVPQPECTGNCAACASAQVCPSCAKPLIPSSSPAEPVGAGMTGVIRPGESLPPLPPVDAPAPMMGAPAPAPAPAQTVAAVDVPKAAVMAEVVRRAMGK